jgi:hypothetical protein
VVRAVPSVLSHRFALLDVASIVALSEQPSVVASVLTCKPVATTVAHAEQVVRRAIRVFPVCVTQPADSVQRAVAAQVVYARSSQQTTPIAVHAGGFVPRGKSVLRERVLPCVRARRPTVREVVVNLQQTTAIVERAAMHVLLDKYVVLGDAHVQLARCVWWAQRVCVSTRRAIRNTAVPVEWHAAQVMCA